MSIILSLNQLIISMPFSGWRPKFYLRLSTITTFDKSLPNFVRSFKKENWFEIQNVYSFIRSRSKWHQKWINLKFFAEIALDLDVLERPFSWLTKDYLNYFTIITHNYHDLAERMCFFVYRGCFFSSCCWCSCCFYVSPILLYLIYSFYKT